MTRTALALRETRHAYLALDVAHFALEQERERVQERDDGELRLRLEETADGLTAWLRRNRDRDE